MVGEGGIHTVSVTLTEGTRGTRLTDGVRVFWNNLTGLGLFARASRGTNLGFTAVHATVLSTGEGTIATRGTLTSHTLTRRLLGGTEGGDFLTKLGDFGEELVHFF